MTAFRIAALCLPAAGAFLAPALWAWKRDWKVPAIGIAGLIGIVILWGVLAGAPAGSLLATAVVSFSFALFALGLSMAAGQVVSGLIVTLACSTLFLAPAVVDDAVRNGRPAQPRVDFLLSVNPWTALATGPFQMDPLRDFPTMYRLHVADYAEARPTPWGSLAAGYALGGVILGAAAIGARRLRRPPPAKSPITNPQASS